jgi:hypothetical protein
MWEVAMRITLKRINAFLHANGMAADVALIKGSGYFYFSGGDTSTWYRSSVMAYRLSDLSLDGWLAEYENCKQSEF